MSIQTSHELIATPRIDVARDKIAEARARGDRIGCVPTMGALHDGHLSLVRAARDECGFVVVTVFVNPTQFGPDEDFEDYPRPLQDDLRACRDEGVDLVLHPQMDVMYPHESKTIVDVVGLATHLEGAYRPGHFRGVATVVVKLLNIVRCDVAYFGQKDFQQQVLIRRMCHDLHIPVEIRACPIVREPDGLALSSRNVYLNNDERRQALALSESLRLAEEMIAGGETNLDNVRDAMRKHLTSMPDVRVDYATIADRNTLEELGNPQTEMVALVAAHVGRTRLIDNLLIQR